MLINRVLTEKNVYFFYPQNLSSINVEPKNKSESRPLEATGTIDKSSLPLPQKVVHPFQTGSHFNLRGDSSISQSSTSNGNEYRQVEADIDVYGGRVLFRPKSEWSPVVEAPLASRLPLTAPANLQPRVKVRHPAINTRAEHPLQVQSRDQTPFHINSYEQPLRVPPYVNGSGVHPKKITTQTSYADQRQCRRHHAPEERRPSPNGNASPIMVFTI